MRNFVAPEHEDVSEEGGGRVGTRGREGEQEHEGGVATSGEGDGRNPLGEEGCRSEHPDVFHEGLVDEFSGMFEDSD